MSNCTPEQHVVNYLRRLDKGCTPYCASYYDAECHGCACRCHFPSVERVLSGQASAQQLMQSTGDRN